jgi:hypothetical protein
VTLLDQVIDRVAIVPAETVRVVATDRSHCQAVPATSLDQAIGQEVIGQEVETGRSRSRVAPAAVTAP